MWAVIISGGYVSKITTSTHAQVVTQDQKQVHGDIRKVAVSMTTENAENAFTTVIFECFLCFLMRS